MSRSCQTGSSSDTGGSPQPVDERSFVPSRAVPGCGLKPTARRASDPFMTLNPAARLIRLGRGRSSDGPRPEPSPSRRPLAPALPVREPLHQKIHETPHLGRQVAACGVGDVHGQARQLPVGGQRHRATISARRARVMFGECRRQRRDQPQLSRRVDRRSSCRCCTGRPLAGSRRSREAAMRSADQVQPGLPDQRRQPLHQLQRRRHKVRRAVVPSRHGVTNPRSICPAVLICTRSSGSAVRKVQRHSGSSCWRSCTASCRRGWLGWKRRPGL